MTAYPLLQIDAFTSEAFAGNPAAVCLLDVPRPDRWMQAVAEEMNLSETAFVVPGQSAFGLRWFTPVAEVDLCGHATLATAHALWTTGRLPSSDVAVFETRSGRLTAERDGSTIWLDFPSLVGESVETPAGLESALGLEQLRCSRARYDLLVEVDGEEQVRSAAPDFAKLEQLEVRGVILTSLASENSPYAVVSRFFGPAVGINEDPVTGSAHCQLAPYWADRLGRKRFAAFQASKRGGTVEVSLEGDRVKLGGQAVTVLEGELRA